jgi:hypothetical protein
MRYYTKNLKKANLIPLPLNKGEAGRGFLINSPLLNPTLIKGRRKSY